MTTAKNTDTLSRTMFIGDNLPLLRQIDTDSIDLIVIDPPFGKSQTFSGSLLPPLTDAELQAEQTLMQSWGVTDAAAAAKVGIEYPDQQGESADFDDLWDYDKVASQPEMTDLMQSTPAIDYLIKSTQLTHSASLAAYILFMAARLVELRRVLKRTGTLYLHCDQSASGYLRQLLDATFGRANFRNEIIWCYKWGGTSSKSKFKTKHDTIYRYTKSDRFTFNAAAALVYGDRSGWSDAQRGRLLNDWWADIPALNTQARERGGYPTQKPQALARRIIEVSSKPGDLVLDCFAGSAYIPVAAELTGRRWLACDAAVRAWTVTLRQFAKHPALKIADAPAEIIRVRGPQQLPNRTAFAP